MRTTLDHINCSTCVALNLIFIQHSLDFQPFEHVGLSQPSMIHKLIEQSCAFIDRLYGNMEYEEQDIYKRTWQGNNSLLYIVHHLKNNRVDLLESFYASSLKCKQFNSHSFFANILSLIRHGYQTDLCKKLLSQLLTLQNNRNELLSMLPIDLFNEIKHSNPVTYQRKLKKVASKEQEVRLQCICESPHGYSQILLVITTFLQNGIVKKPHQEAWSRILDIVGRHNLDFHRVIDIMLSKIVECLQYTSTHQQLAILQNISFESFLQLVSKNICRRNQEWPDSLTPSDSIFNLVGQDTLVLYEKGIYFYHPRYLELIRILINRGTYKIEQFLPHFYCLTPQDIADDEEKRLKIVEQGGTFSFGLNYDVKGKIFMGQAMHCFRLSLMCQCIRGNDFSLFKQLYSSIWPQGRFDVIIHAPIIRQFCLLIDWIIEPIYNNYFYVFKFKKRQMPRNAEKVGGYFRQYGEINQAFFEDIQLILSYLQINIGFHLKSLIKLVRVFKIILKENSLKIEWNMLNRYRNIIKQFIKLYLLPAITLYERNANVSSELYTLLQQFSQADRFQIYNHYYNQVMLHHPFLVQLLQKVIKDQTKINTDLSKSQQILRTQHNHRTKIQHNQFFQSSFFILKRALSKKYEHEYQFQVKSIGSSTPLAGDVMLFLALSYIHHPSEKQQKQVMLAYFIYLLFRHCPQLDMSYFVKSTLQRMCQGTPEDFLRSLNIFKYILDQIFPDLIDYSTLKLRLNLLTFGYHFKLDTTDQIKRFDQDKHIRLRLQVIFSSKVISTFETQHSLLYYFIYTLSRQISIMNNYENGQISTYIKPIISLKQNAQHIDLCMNVLSTLTRFYTYQIDRIREAHPQRILQSNSACISDNEFIELIRDQTLKAPLPIVCQLLRSFKRQELFAIKTLFQPIPLKKFWQKIYTNYFFNPTQLPAQVQAIDSAKATSFIHSDLYFFFWTCELQNICQLEEAYKEKIDSLRKIISDDIFRAGNQMEKQNKERYILAFKMVQKERDEMNYYYQKFNISLPAVNSNNKQTHERISKLTIPPSFMKEKDDNVFNQFVSLLFLHCLLPRIVINFTQAIFCSKIVYKIIKENKLPSNKSLYMIFTIMEIAISYVPHSTKRQIDCIAIFTTDFLRIFSEWDKMDELSIKLQDQIGMEKFSQKRYEKLKDFIKHFQTKVIDILIIHRDEPFVIGNCLQFLQRSQYLPLSQGQVEKIIKHLSMMNFGEDNKVSTNIKRIISIIESRKKRLGSFATINYEAQLKKYGVLPQRGPALAPKPKIYKQQQIKKNKKKECVNIF